MALRFEPALESIAAAPIAAHYDHFIDGAWTQSTGGERFATIDPANETELSRVACGTGEDIARAVAAARTATSTWGRMPGRERAIYLYRIARAITERSREFAVLETRDGGKPIAESRDFDIPTAAAHFFYYAGWADKLAYALPGTAAPAPLGVVGAIVPWNFPLLMAAWKIAPALACGNTIVLKPAETTPLTALRLADVIADAGLPAGTVNIVTGDGATGAALVAAEVDKIAFTGSTAVGKGIARAIAGTKKRATLELGGKAANIVFADAARDEAIDGIVNAIYFNQGHVCCAGSRLLVEERAHDDIVARLTERLRTLRLGQPLDKNTDIGAINSREQYDRIVALVQSGIDDGATLVQAPCAIPERGFFYPPSFFTGAAPTQRIVREEIFGPVLTILTFRTAAEAIEKANATPYGLSAGVWTSDGAKARFVAARLRAGVVWCNTFNRFDASAAFGGYRESGYGREGGPSGLHGYLSA